MLWLRAISTNVPILQDEIETNFTSKTPRKMIPVLKGIPKVLKESSLASQETHDTNAKSLTLPRFVREINAGENRVDKKARTSITLIKIVASMTTSA